jgi:2-phospho-L-lactate guanylyltransferase
VLVPIKRLDDAKTRLSEVLAPADRAGLMRDLLGHVLAVVEEADVGPVTVVSHEELPLNGVGRYDDRGLPWNDALAAALRDVDDEIAVVVAADLPLLDAEDVRALVAATPTRGVAIARARDGGTNGVAMRPPGILETHFGEAQSAALHEGLAHALGLEAVVVDRPGLAFDIDTPEDLAAWRDRSP